MKGAEANHYRCEVTYRPRSTQRPTCRPRRRRPRLALERIYRKFIISDHLYFLKGLVGD